jgi:hypothetical protein
MQELSEGLLALGPLIREIPPSPRRRRRVPGALAAGRHRRTRNGAARARTPPLPPEPRPNGLFHSPTARPSCRRRTRSVKLKRVREMFFPTVRVSVLLCGSPEHEGPAGVLSVVQRSVGAVRAHM